MSEMTPSIIQELTFLKQQTGQDEIALLTQALNLGLNLLYRQAVEQALIDETLTRDEAIVALGPERVEELAYAKQALVQDIAQGMVYSSIVPSI